MSRIAKAYETRFRSMLQQTGARRLQKGLDWLAAKAARLETDQRLTPADALTRVHGQLAARLAHRKQHLSNSPQRFLCDAGLGGLARWLRAAGHDAQWRADIDDDELVHLARQTHDIILTTDSMLMERRVLRDRIIPAYWLPPTLSIPEQLSLVFQEFNLQTGEPRCMQCGGELVHADKQSLRERIPPRTFRWLDEYFLCSRCGKLFWRGTHWERIQRELCAVLGEPSSQP